MKRPPVLTLVLSALTLAVHLLPVSSLIPALQFDRATVAHGQLWRFFTAHLTHFNTDHLRWDLIAFLVLGALAERLSRSAFIVTLLASSAVITLGVWLAQPQFTTYRGLSGIDSALFGFVIAHQLRAGIQRRHTLTLITASLALGAFAAKCLYELATGGAVFVDTADTFAPVPLAHLLGLVTGAVAQFISNRRNKSVTCSALIDCNVPPS